LPISEIEAFPILASPACHRAPPTILPGNRLGQGSRRRHCSSAVTLFCRQEQQTSKLIHPARGMKTNEDNMKKRLIAVTAAALMIAPAAFAQSGANPSAPQVNSAGNGVTQPGTTSTGTAVDRPTSSTPHAAPHAAGSQTGNNASSLSGSNAATGTTGSNSSAEGRTSGGGAGGGGAGGGN
jgi:hypothetical protein